MGKKAITSEKIVVTARLAFARLDKPKAFQPGQDPRYESTFLLDPSDAKQKAELHKVVKEAARIGKEFYGFVPQEVKRVGAALGIPGVTYDPKAKADGIKFDCLFDGDTKSYDGFAGRWAIQTHNKTRPALGNRKGESVLPGEDQFPYGGCFVLGKLTLWTQENDFGKRINANLVGVQFRAAGERFGAGEYKAEDEFTAMEDDGPTDAGGAADSPFGD